MDPDAFTSGFFKWDPRQMIVGTPQPPPPPPPPTNPPPYAAYSTRQPREQLGGLDNLFEAYGIRYYTVAKIAELGFTMSTLLNMKDEELDEMMTSLSHIFRWDLLVGERYGVKAAVRAERRRLDLDQLDTRRRQHHLQLLSSDNTTLNALHDALSQEGLSEEQGYVEREMVGSGGGGTMEAIVAAEQSGRKQRGKKVQRKAVVVADSDQEDEDNNHDNGTGISERQREHPFIVTEPGEVARGKKNGLDYLFHLYEQCREFLIQVQNIAKERGDKCPTKVTNQVFRYAKKAGASYINKPKMRHYVHCYALHCLDEEASNVLRRSFKERGENVGAWRQACYAPLVNLSAQHGWKIDDIFSAHPRLAIWYVPTKLRQLCHAAATSSRGGNVLSGGCSDHGRALF